MKLLVRAGDASVSCPADGPHESHPLLRFPRGLQMQLRQQRPRPASCSNHAPTPRWGSCSVFPVQRGASLRPLQDPLLKSYQRAGHRRQPGQEVSPSPSCPFSLDGERALRTQVSPAGPQDSGHKDQPRGLSARDPPFPPHARSTSQCSSSGHTAESPSDMKGGPFQKTRDPNRNPHHLRSSVVLVEVPHGNVRPVDGAVTVGRAHPLQFILGRKARRGGNGCFWHLGMDGVPPKLGFPVPVHISGECRSCRGRSPPKGLLGNAPQLP